MKKKRIFTFLVGFLLVLLTGLMSSNSSLIFPVSAQSTNITISAAISLKDSLEEIKILYQKKAPKAQITYNFASSGSLQQQIEQGAPVDIFISAANKQMDTLESKNLLLSSSRHNLVTNQLVLITAKNEKNINKFSDLTKPTINKIALGEPKSVPAGKYGEEVLKFYKILDKINSKIVYAKDVRQVLTYVETENVNAGLVYITDAKPSEKVRIAAIAPKESHSPIVYPIAILKDSKNLDTAKAFDQFLKSNQSKTIFKKYGFGTP
jgi:molybdate transport system substrate-binding protein